MTHQGGEPDPEDGNVDDCALHEVLRRDSLDTLTLRGHSVSRVSFSKARNPISCLRALA